MCSFGGPDERGRRVYERIYSDIIHLLTRRSCKQTSAPTIQQIRLLASFAHPRIVRLYETFMGEYLYFLSYPRSGLVKNVRPIGPH